MPQDRKYFTKVAEEGFAPNYGDTLGKQYSEGLITFQDIQRFFHEGKFNFWHLFDFSCHVSKKETEVYSWINEQIMKLADDTYTCTVALRNIPFNEEQTKVVKTNARNFAKSTDDFLELSDMDLFRKEDLPQLLSSPENMEDHVHIYNFLFKDSEYKDSFSHYKKEFCSHIHTLEDFQEIYMHIDDEELRNKAKEAIEEITGTSLPATFHTEQLPY